MKKFVIKPGHFEQKRTGKSQPGLDLWRVTLDTLVDRSLAVTTNCCNYYPTAPLIDVADITTPTEDEMDAAGVPPYGMFMTYDAGAIHVWMREDVGDGAFELGSND